MRPRDPLDEAMQAQPPEVVRHPAGGNGFGALPGERGDMLAQIAVSETARQETEQDQGGPQDQHAGIGKAQRRSALPVHLAGAIHLLKRFFSQAAIVAEALDFEQTSVGLKAELPQTRQITERLAASEVAGIANRGFSTQGPSLSVVLLDAGGLVVDVQRGRARCCGLGVTTRSSLMGLTNRNSGARRGPRAAAWRQEFNHDELTGASTARPRSCP